VFGNRDIALGDGLRGHRATFQNRSEANRCGGSTAYGLMAHDADPFVTIRPCKVPAVTNFLRNGRQMWR
jgi:hypothetical protein